MSLVTQYGGRLLKLRVTEAEVKSIIRSLYQSPHLIVVNNDIHCRLTPTGKSINIRVFVSSDSTFTITTHMYREAEDPRTGEVGYNFKK